MSNIIQGNTVEQNRFVSISDFKWCMKCGGEVIFEWKGNDYCVFAALQKTPDSPIQMYIGPTDETLCKSDDTIEEKWCDSSDEILEYIVGGDRLRDIITKVIVLERTM